MEMKINYEAVYSKTAEIRQRIQSELQEVETSHRQVNTSLTRMDSRTNAVLIEAIQSNRQKCQVTGETLTKLLTFIEAAARQVERDEAMIARAFSQVRGSSSTRQSSARQSNTTQPNLQTLQTQSPIEGATA